MPTRIRAFAAAMMFAACTRTAPPTATPTPPPAAATIGPAESRPYVPAAHAHHAPPPTAAQPAGTLRPDEFDAPAPSSVEEAKKAAQPAAEHHHHDGGTP